MTAQGIISIEQCLLCECNLWGTICNRYNGK